MICPDCGQTLPDSGVCYNCQKNINDANRFGRGSGIVPAYIKYGPGGIASRHKDPGPRKKLPARRKRADRPVVSGGWSRRRRRSTPKRQRPPKRVRLQPVWKLQLTKRPLRGVSLAYQRRGVNEFLEAVYRQPMLISDVLKRRRFSNRQINVVKGEVANYLALLLATLYNRWYLILTSGQTVAIAQFYSFNGTAPRDKEYLAQKLRIPIKSFTDDLNEAITKLRRPNQRRHIDRMISDTAKSILQNICAL